MNPGMEHISLGDHMAFTGIIVYGLQALKKWTGCSWINPESDTLNRAISVAASFVAAVGVSLAIEGNFHSGGKIVISWPDAGSMIDLGRHWVTQFVLNQLVYKSAVK